MQCEGGVSNVPERVNQRAAQARGGRTPLALTDVALELGTISGGKSEALRAQGIGFTAVLGTWSSQLRAKLTGGATLSPTSGGATASGSLCAQTAKRCCNHQGIYVVHLSLPGRSWAIRGPGTPRAPQSSPKTLETALRPSGAPLEHPWGTPEAPLGRRGAPFEPT